MFMEINYIDNVRSIFYLILILLRNLILTSKITRYHLLSILNLLLILVELRVNNPYFTCLLLAHCQ
mgnify:CR=1 FL=1